MSNALAMGVLASVMAVLVASLIAFISLWPRRNLDYGSTVLSDRDLWHVEVALLTAWLWPLMAGAAGAVVSWLTGISRPWLVGGLSSLLAVGALAMLQTARIVLRRIRYEGDRRLSERTKLELEPIILRRWRHLGINSANPRIEVRAFRTLKGIQGSVTIWLPQNERPSPEVFAQLVPVLPPYLKLRLDNRRIRP